MRMAQQPPPLAYALLDFPATSVRSVLTAASLTPASMVATVQTTVWPSRASVRTASPASPVMTPPRSRPAPASPVPTGARVLVNLMEHSGAFARNGLLVQHVPCRTDLRPGPSWWVPGLWPTECSLWLHNITPFRLTLSTSSSDPLREICSRLPWRRQSTPPASSSPMDSLCVLGCWPCSPVSSSWAPQVLCFLAAVRRGWLTPSTASLYGSKGNTCWEKPAALPRKSWSTQ